MKRIAVIAVSTLMTFSGATAAHANGNAWGKRAMICTEMSAPLGQILKLGREVHSARVMTPQMLVMSPHCSS